MRERTFFIDAFPFSSLSEASRILFISSSIDRIVGEKVEKFFPFSSCSLCLNGFDSKTSSSTWSEPPNTINWEEVFWGCSRSMKLNYVLSSLILNGSSSSIINLTHLSIFFMRWERAKAVSTWTWVKFHRMQAWKFVQSFISGFF